MPRFSAHLTQLFTERPFAERFAAAAACGFVACEFRSPFEHDAREVAAWSRDAALPIVLFNAPAGRSDRGERGLAALPGREADFDEAMAVALRHADALDVPMVHVMAGVVPTGVDAALRAADHATYRATFVANLRRAARLFAGSGRTILIEALNPQDNPGYLLTTQADAQAIRAEVDEPNLFVQFDCYHAAMTEGVVLPLLEDGIAAIRHIQVAGAPGRHEPDTGSVDYATVFATIDRLPYDGWVGCEYKPAARTDDGLGWMRTLAR